MSARGATFRAHASDTLGYARVTEIAEADVAPVYDIEVSGPHNFVAEGIVVHNSEVVYHRNREDLEKLGVLFTDGGHYHAAGFLRLCGEGGIWLSSRGTLESDTLAVVSDFVGLDDTRLVLDWDGTTAVP